MISYLVYINRYFYAFNQVRSRSIYSTSGLSAISLYTKGFCYLVNALTDKTDIHIREKF